MRKGKYKAQQYIKKYKASHRCVDCGEDDSKVLTFHHLGVKRGDVRDFVKKGSLRQLKYELTGCELLCRECHDLRHDSTPKGPKFPKEITQEDRNRAVLMSLFPKENS